MGLPGWDFYSCLLQRNEEKELPVRDNSASSNLPNPNPQSLLLVVVLGLEHIMMGEFYMSYHIGRSYMINNIPYNMESINRPPPVPPRSLESEGVKNGAPPSHRKNWKIRKREREKTWQEKAHLAYCTQSNTVSVSLSLFCPTNSIVPFYAIRISAVNLWLWASSASNYN